MLRPRMPRWFRPVWDWAGRADDVLGRLHVLRDAGTILAAAFVIVGVVLLNTVGAWGALAILAAIGFALFAIVDQVVSHRARTVARAASGSGETVAEQAAVLVAEMRSFYIEQREGLPPLELVLVGAPPNGLEQWQASRDAAIVVEFNRVFGDRLREIYEALRASRGYGHPLMEGRYDSIRSPGEIVTVARALSQIVGAPFRPIPPVGEEDSVANQGTRVVRPAGNLELVPQRLDGAVPPELVRPDWNASCEPVAASLATTFGRGVVLSIESRDTELDLRCVVVGPDGARQANVVRILDAYGYTRSSERYHWPGEFEPPRSRPWPVGYYSYAWIGDLGDVGEGTRSFVLARRFFFVDEDDTIVCHMPMSSDSA